MADCTRKTTLSIAVQNPLTEGSCNESNTLIGSYAESARTLCGLKVHVVAVRVCYPGQARLRQPSCLPPIPLPRMPALVPRVTRRWGFKETQSDQLVLLRAYRYRRWRERWRWKCLQMLQRHPDLEVAPEGELIRTACLHPQCGEQGEAARDPPLLKRQRAEPCRRSR